MKDNKVKFWSIMWQYLKEMKLGIVLAIIASMIVGTCVSMQPLVIKYIVDDGISSTTLDTDGKLKYIFIMCCVYVVISLVRVLTWSVGIKNLLSVLEGTIFSMRAKLFQHIQQMGMKFYESTSSGEIYNVIMGSPITKIRDYLMQLFIAVPCNLISLIISLFALFSYDYILTLILLATAIVMALLHRLSRKRIRKASKEFISTESQASSFLSDTLHGIDAVIMYGIERNTENNVKNVLGEVKEKSQKNSFLQTVENLKPEFAQYLGTAVVYFVGAISCIYRDVSIGVLYAFLSSMGIIMGVLISWMNIGLVKSSAEAGLEKVQSVLDSKTTTPEPENGKARSLEIEREKSKSHNRPCVSFKNVDFGYGDNSIFTDFSCDIKYNESVALVGGSGSGKSTFTKLLMRLYDINSGSITFHGNDVREYELSELRKSFGIVPQNPFIFRGSIWDNVRIACPEAENRDIIKAMEIAHMHEFINELPNGWHTQIGDGALNLSGGQRQRIAIARAVLGNPDVLIFDEATSALDNISERCIQEAMEELMKTHTVIVVAHRLTTIKNVDRIMVFDNGKVIEEGDFETLKNADGTFSKMLNYR